MPGLLELAELLGRHHGAGTGSTAPRTIATNFDIGPYLNYSRRSPSYYRKKMGYGVGVSKRRSTTKRKSTYGMTKRRGRPAYYGYKRYNGEKKFIDQYEQNLVISNTASTATAVTAMDSLLTIPQNLTSSGRVGRLIKIHELSIRGHFKVQTITVTSGSDMWNLRIILVIDNQCNASNASAADFLQEVTPAANDPNFHSFKDLRQGDRFTTLFDKVYIKKLTGGAGDQNGSKLAGDVIKFNYYKKFKKPIVIEYDGATGSISERLNKNLVLWDFHDSGSLDVTKFLSYRMRYTDA